jgi:hypothetical protein
MSDANPEPRVVTDTEAIAEIHTMLSWTVETLTKLQVKIEDLEKEFVPLARKYRSVIGAAASLPGAGFRRKGS